ncbi:MurR/RpiR family transcriptional regulator [Kribbella sp. NPDC058693]|uniref:MurR/RpiR family transcriptional regulator n=1 Tax=Kribbella jiaozuonensis TaxID=2575441 RepID=A0A4U3LNH0_9ACTN|nr:MurR/RpiR family transcriptional regulator [Kribbella jiaozuonensis]TKK76759.1 MurR/RpiR family transcriptional regulator [Kribbella jiaozuonensis]
MTDQGPSVAEWLDKQVGSARLGPKAERVRHVVATQPSFASYATAAEVAERAEVNGATVVRFAQSLGFAGWPQFQAEFRSMYVVRRYDVEAGAPTTGHAGVLASAFARDAENLQSCLQSFDYEEGAAVVEAIHAARRTLVVATGTHSLPAQGLAMMAASRGYDISLEDRSGPHLTNALARLTSDDCVVAFSFWQHYKQTVAALRFARTVGATTCAITDTRHSPAADHADHILIIPAEGISNFRSMTVATSLAYGLAAALVAIDPQRTRSAISHVDALWQDMNFFVPD